jgi:hypothetical protein
MVSRREIMKSIAMNYQNLILEKKMMRMMIMELEHNKYIHIIRIIVAA